MDFSDISTDDLKAELERRERTSDRPAPLENPDFSRLLKTCEAVMNDYERDGRSKDNGHYIYEEAMQAVYGDNVFEWINQVIC